MIEITKRKKTPKIGKKKKIKKISTENSNGGNDFYTFFVQSGLLLMKRFNEGQSTKTLLLIFGGECDFRYTTIVSFWIHEYMLFDCLSIAVFFLLLLYFDCEISRVERSSSLMASIQCLKSQVICANWLKLLLSQKCCLRWINYHH